MINRLKLWFLFLILISSNSFAGINDKQKTVIKANLFLMQENMISKKDVFEKAKLFDSKGFFGINSDIKTKSEFENFVKQEIEFQELLEEEALSSEN